MLGVVLVLMLVPGPVSPGWDAAMCLPGRYDRAVYAFSACDRGPVDYEAFCRPYNTRFAIRTGLMTRERCLDVIRQNYPNLWRFRNRKVQPIICDFNIEGLPAECYADP